MKLSLEHRNHGGVMIVHCQGRIVYGDDATALARLLAEVLEQTSRVVLDLSGVTSMDGAGIGELVQVHTSALARNANVKCAGANELVRNLLELTNLNTVLEIYESLEEALESFHEDRVWADC